MRKFGALFKAQFLSMITFSLKKKSLRLPVFASLIAGGGVLFYFLVRLAIYLFGLKLPYQFSQTSLTPIILNGVVFGMLVFLFLGSLGIVLSSLYLSSDTKLILSMPLTQSVVFSSKFLFATFEESFYPLFLVYPFFFGFGLKYHLGLVYFLLSFVFVLALPFIPLSVAAVIIIPLASKLPAKKLQNVVYILNMLFGILVYFVTQITMNPAFHFVNKNNTGAVYKTFGTVLRFLTGNIAASFSFAFKEGNLLKGVFEIAIFAFFGIVLFYVSLLFAKNHYEEGIFKAERISSVKVSAHSAESGVIGGRFLPRHLGALISKDMKVFSRDSKIKASLLMEIGYVVFFIFIFVIGPAAPNSASGPGVSFDKILMPIMGFAIIDFMLCGQPSLILLFLDRESIWVPLLSPVKGNEFIWSKLIPPVFLAEVFNIIAIFVFLLKFYLKSVNSLFLYLPFALFLPFLLTASSVSVGMLFPNFRSPSDPRKLISGKAVIVNSILYFVYIIFSLGAAAIVPLLVKLKGVAFASTVLFIVVGTVSVSVSFSLIAYAIRKYSRLEIT